MGWEDAPLVPQAPARAPWENAPLVERRKQPRTGSGFGDAWSAGYQGSGTGLAIRGKLPDVVLDPQHAKWYEKLTASAAQLVAEAPQSVVGAVIGAPMGAAAGGVAGPGGAIAGGLAGGGAGAFAIPTAMRESLIQAYEKGTVVSSGDFINRAGVVLKATGIDALVGAGTMLAGMGAARAVGGAIAPAIGQSIGVTGATRVIGTAGVAAEIGAMTTLPAALHGKMPEPEDFLNAGILVAGMKGATAAASKLGKIYAKTGVRPEQVVADAKADPVLRTELKGEPPWTPTPFEQVIAEQKTMEAAQRKQLSQMDAADLRVAAEQAVNHNFQVEREAVKQFLGDAKLAEFDALPNRRAQDRWLDNNITEQAQEFLNRKQVNESMFKDYERAALDFDNSSPEALGRSIAVNSRNVDQPGFMESPEGLTFRNAMRYAKDQGWDMEKVLGAMRQRSAEWAGADAPELFARLYREATNAPARMGESRKTLELPDLTKVEAKVEGAAKLETKPDPFAEFGSEIPKAYEPLRRELMVRDALQDEGHAMRIADVLTNPEGRVTAEKEPNHINYKYVESPDDVKAVHARIAEVFEAQLNEARGKESWEKTQESAANLLAERGLKAEGGDFNKLAAKGMAWEAMAQRAAHDVQQAAAEVRALDKAADPVAHAEATKKMVLAIENAAFLHAIDQANGAEIARALAARKAAKQTAALAKDVGDLFAQYGHDPKKLADLIGEMDTTAKVTKFAKEAAKATTFDKYIEALKSGLVSGPISQIKNIMGNSTFLVARPLIDAAAVIGGKVNISEPALRVIGNIQGLLEALEIGAGFARANWNVPMQAIRALDKGDTKSESYKNAIGGDLGVIVRTPFTALRVADTTFRMMIERGEINTLAAREAAKERYNPLTAEFRQRMAELAQNPTEAMLKSAEQAGLRFTFNAELGPAGKAFQRLLDEAPILKVFVPFVRTPGNVFKEMFRLTPFAPFIDTWRADFNKGGADRHKAYAEVVIGSLLAGTVMAMVNDKKDKWITGQLDADPAKKNIQLAAGMQPYSVKIQGKWYDYSALQPLGTLLGLAVDIAQAWDLIGTQEQDKIVRVLSIGFANSVTNQTFLQGAVSITHLLTEPDRYGPKIMQSLAAMHVPSILAQNAALMDPYVREINGVLDAVKNRIPGVRETLFAQRDPFGEQIKNPERLGVVSPIKTRTPETDPVYTEAARLGVGVSRTPKNIELPTKIGDKKLGKVELTPEQRDIFGDKAGNFAYDILEPIVGTPAWNAAPDLQRKQTYDRVFQKANQVGKWEALTPEQRAIEFHRIQTEITYRLYQSGPRVE